jgi:hypothetical protein
VELARAYKLNARIHSMELKEEELQALYTSIAKYEGIHSMELKDISVRAVEKCEGVNPFNGIERLFQPFPLSLPRFLESIQWN